jgi:hypothetical protein
MIFPKKRIFVQFYERFPWNVMFSIVDAFAGKKKLKDALSGVLQDVK